MAKTMMSRRYCCDHVIQTQLRIESALRAKSFPFPSATTEFTHRLFCMWTYVRNTFQIYSIRVITVHTDSSSLVFSRHIQTDPESDTV